MRNAYLPFLLSGTAVLLVSALFPGLGAVVLPGWHTQVSVLYTVAGLGSLLWCFVLAAAYFLLGRRGAKIKNSYLLLHLALTLPIVGLMAYPSSVYGYSGFKPLFFLALSLFLIGQSVFAWFCLARLVTSKGGKG